MNSGGLVEFLQFCTPSPGRHAKLPLGLRDRLRRPATSRFNCYNRNRVRHSAAAANSADLRACWRANHREIPCFPRFSRVTLASGIHPSCRVLRGRIHLRPHHGSTTSIRGSAHRPLGAVTAHPCGTERSDSVESGHLAGTESFGVRDSSTAGTSPLHHPVLVRCSLPQLWWDNGLCPLRPRTVGSGRASECGCRSIRRVVRRGSSVELGQCVAAAVSRRARHRRNTDRGDAGSDCLVDHAVGRPAAGLVAIGPDLVPIPRRFR
jgi:hypothetical protein